MNDIKKNLIDIKNDCSSVRGVNDICDKINLDDLVTGVDFIDFFDVLIEFKKVEDVVN